MGACQQGLLSSNASLGGLALFQSWQPTVVAGGAPNNFFNVSTLGELGGGVQTIHPTNLLPDWYPLLRSVAAISGYEVRVSIIADPTGQSVANNAAFGTWFAPSSAGGNNQFNLFNANIHTTATATWQLDVRRASSGVVLSTSLIHMVTIFP